MAGVLHQAPTIDLENLMNRADETDSSTAHGLLLARKAILEGRMHLPPHLQRIADELTSAPLTAFGLVDPTGLSRETVMMAKSFAAATAMARQPSPEDSPAASPKPASELQAELFQLFNNLFSGITGRAHGLIDDEKEIKPLILSRIQDQPSLFLSLIHI